MILPFRLPHHVQVHSPTSRHRRPSSVLGRDSFYGTSIDILVSTLQGLSLTQSWSAIHLPTTSRFGLRIQLHSLLPSSAWFSWLRWRCPVFWLSTNSWPGPGHFMPWVVCSGSCSVLTTVHIGAQEEGFWRSSFSLLLYLFAGLTANLCCVESGIPRACVSPASFSSAPRELGEHMSMMDIHCQLSRRWRSSRLPTSFASNQRLIPYSVTTWRLATCMAHMLSGTPQSVFVMVRSLAFDSIAF